jgi:uncharacterized protein (TIGR01777 family)
VSEHSTEQGQRHSGIEGNLQVKPAATVLIAGGTGLIGQRLKQLLEKKGHTVLVLTRRPKASHEVYWDPSQKQIDLEKLTTVQCIINLCGENIGAARWTTSRKATLIKSRVEPAQFLASILDKLPALNYYIGASGVNCYAAEQGVVYHESAPYGQDFLSAVVQEWEKAHQEILKHVRGSVLRIAMVLSAEGGALAAMKRPIELGFGSAIGSGKQMSPWIQIDDLCELMVYALEQQLEGTYNALAANNSNLELTQHIAQLLRKPLWAPKVPAFALKLLLGERAFLVLTDLKASNQKIIQTGFSFKYPDLKQALKPLLTKS